MNTGDSESLKFLPNKPRPLWHLWLTCIMLQTYLSYYQHQKSWFQNLYLFFCPRFSFFMHYCCAPIPASLSLAGSEGLPGCWPDFLSGQLLNAGYYLKMRQVAITPTYIQSNLHAQVTVLQGKHRSPLSVLVG